MTTGNLRVRRETVCGSWRGKPRCCGRSPEATAALQDLAYRFALAADPESARSRLAELRAIQAELPRAVRAAHNGPYLVTNTERLVSWLGVPLQKLDARLNGQGEETSTR